MLRVECFAIDSQQDLSDGECKKMDRWKGIFLLEGESRVSTLHTNGGQAEEYNCRRALSPDRENEQCCGKSSDPLVL